MAGKPMNRLELRRQNEAAEPLDPMEVEADELLDETEDEETTERRAKKKKPAVQKTKEPMPDNAPGLGAQIPRPTAAPAEPAAKQAAAAVEDEDEIDEEEEESEELDDEADEEE